MLLSSVVIALFSSLLVYAEVDQCQSNCRESALFRLVGPTRPWFSMDELGNELHLTKPYPYNFAGFIVENCRFNITYSVMKSINATEIDGLLHLESNLKAEKDQFVEIVKETLLNATQRYFEFEILSDTIIEAKQSTMVNTSKLEMVIQIDQPFLDSNNQTVGDFDFQNLEIVLKTRVADKSGLLDHSDLYNITRILGISSQMDSQIMHAGEPNPFSQFCELGCSLFYSSTSDPLHISECTDKCDDIYRYNISVGYNDLIEVARLECRDGCQIGLMRCQPGYFCSQVRVKELLDDDELDLNFDGGIMAHCPAGTYRDVSYDAVEDCVPCPPGRFREDVKGRSLDGCNKCPARTYNSLTGSSTIRDCLRCPAGTFTNEPGSARCICITPSACDNEFPSPADAEKRETIPFIGFW